MPFFKIPFVRVRIRSFGVTVLRVYSVDAIFLTYIQLFFFQMDKFLARPGSGSAKLKAKSDSHQNPFIPWVEK